VEELSAFAKILPSGLRLLKAYLACRVALRFAIEGSDDRVKLARPLLGSPPEGE
jgi:hypothetical protein